MLKEFRSFILRGNVVDLAVGVVIGAAFTSIVNALVSGMLNPLIAVFGDTGLNDLRFAIGTRMVETATGTIPSPNYFEYGRVLDAIVQFLLLAAVVFFSVVKPLNHLMARVKPDPPAGQATRPCPECLGDVPIGASRCRHCTTELAG